MRNTFPRPRGTVAALRGLVHKAVRLVMEAHKENGRMKKFKSKTVMESRPNQIPGSDS